MAACPYLGPGMAADRSKSRWRNGEHVTFAFDRPESDIAVLVACSHRALDQKDVDILG